MTEEERLELQRDFCVKTVQDMSSKDLISFAYNVLMDSYSAKDPEGKPIYDDEDFTEEVKAWFPELLTSDVKKEERCD